MLGLEITLLVLAPVLCSQYKRKRKKYQVNVSFCASQRTVCFQKRAYFKTFHIIITLLVYFIMCC